MVFGALSDPLHSDRYLGRGGAGQSGRPGTETSGRRAAPPIPTARPHAARGAVAISVIFQSAHLFDGLFHFISASVAVLGTVQVFRFSGSLKALCGFGGAGRELGRAELSEVAITASGWLHSRSWTHAGHARPR